MGQQTTAYKSRAQHRPKQRSQVTGSLQSLHSEHNTADAISAVHTASSKYIFVHPSRYIAMVCIQQDSGHTCKPVRSQTCYVYGAYMVRLCPRAVGMSQDWPCDWTRITVILACRNAHHLPRAKT